ncbi:MAG: histidine kinase dimerization/phosphoacceptor domain -containing protein [Terracidiphilus sp.]|jgi:PAS domain S-box-containing protein
MSSLSIAEAPTSSRRVLLVEDDPGTAELMRRTLSQSGYSVEIANGVEAGLKALRSKESASYAALLLDYQLPDGEPWMVADVALARAPEVPVVFVTGISDETVAIEALRRGFSDFVKKTDGFWNELPAVLERVARLSRMKNKLDETSALMHAIVEHSSDLVAVYSGEGKLVYVSPICLSLLGKDSEELAGRSWMEIVVPEDREHLLEMLIGLEENAHQEDTLRCCRKDGSIAWVEARAARLQATTAAQPMIVLTLHDVTAPHEHAERMEASLKEKEVLLGEIHHRVKNNLQVIQSLLRMRARLLPEGEARAAMESTVQRIYAMALAHEHLYQREDLARLSLSDYLHDLFEGVVASSAAQPDQIQLHLDAEEFSLSLELAIPFGLMVNELIANCFKHGFPEGRRGTVTLSIHRVNGAVHLIVGDDGIGLPQRFDLDTCPSMGLKLAASLAHQLGGTLRFSSQNGCRVETNLTRM